MYGHNYWNNRFSPLKQINIANVKTLDEYYAKLDAGTLPVMRGVALNADDLIRRDVIDTQRGALVRLRDDGSIDDDVVRRGEKIHRLVELEIGAAVGERQLCAWREVVDDLEHRGAFGATSRLPC